MPLDVWPLRALTPTQVSWRLAGVADAGARTVSGISRPRRSDGGGYWTCAMTVPLRRSLDIRAARGLEALLEGGLGVMIVPAMECNFAPYPGPRRGWVPHSDGATFDDDADYASQLVDIRLHAGAALRATSITVDLVSAAPLTGGERFSLIHAPWDEGGVDKRIYTVKRAAEPVAGVGDAPATQVLTLDAPVREAIAAVDDLGQPTALDFDTPGCVMRLTNPDGFLSAIRLGRFGEVTAEFEEAFE